MNRHLANHHLVKELCVILSTFASTLILLGYFETRQVNAQSITPTTSNGTGSLITTNGSQLNITGGTVQNGNLFHSFDRFGVNTNQTANFQSNSTINNILGRITGNNPSIINGLVQVTGGTSHLFLINPAGIIFGTNATLNVPGSFTATTANGIKFDNEKWLNTIGTNNYSELTGNPSGYAFSSDRSGTIVNTGNLGVGIGKNLSLIGGTVINTGTLTTNSGRVTVRAIGGGMVQVSDTNGLLSLELPLGNDTGINATASPLSLPALLTGSGIPEAQGITLTNGLVYLSSTGAVIPTTPGNVTIAGSINTATLGNSGNVIIGGSEKITIAKSLLPNSNSTISLEAPTIDLNAPIQVGINQLSGTATSINVGISGRLRDAVDVAGPNATVTLSSARYILNPEGNQGEIKILRPITIQGSTGANRTTIAATNVSGSGNQSRAFNIGNTTATIRDLVIENGFSNDVGGAILNRGNLTLNQVTLQNNTTGNDGGAIYNATGNQLTINNSTLKDNTAADDGGAIANHGTMTINNSTINNNIANSGSSMFSGGGGILNTTEATLTINNSTISGNRAKVGGGIRNDGALSLDSTTITNNTATSGGGGVVNTANPITSAILGRTTIKNTIVAKNIAPTAQLRSQDVAGGAGSFTDLGQNLIGVRDGFNSTIATTTKSGTSTNPLDPKLAVLGNYGGPSETHALLLNSPALNVGNTSLVNDQRGKTRTGPADIGSFESGGFTLSAVNSNSQPTVVNTTLSPLRLQVEAVDPGVPISGSLAIDVVATSNINGAGLQNSFPQTVTLDSAGKGSIVPIANKIAGSHTAKVTATDIDESANFNLVNIADTASQITALSGSDQATIVNKPFTNKLEAKVLDQYGNPVANTSVSFMVPDTGASGSTMILIATTDSNGIANLSLNANGLVGTFTVTGKINGNAAIAKFTLTNQAAMEEFVNPTNNPPINNLPIVNPIVNPIANPPIVNPIPKPSDNANPVVKSTSVTKGQEIERSRSSQSVISPLRPTSTPILCVDNSKSPNQELGELELTLETNYPNIPSCIKR